MHYYIKADSFLLENREETDAHYLEVKDGIFGRLLSEPTTDANIIDCSSCCVAPGLFDTHIHGLNGAEVMDGTMESFETISKALLSIGVTRFLPTTLTASFEQLLHVSKQLKQAIEFGLSGAVPEGIYFEGPYFTEEHKGAQNPKYFRNPDLTEFHRLQEASGNHIVKLALAPERKGALNFIKRLSEEHVVIALGHTDASYELTKEAITAGAKIFVHLFNGMRGIHHRDPGVAGACLMDSHTFAELICDGHHVCPEMVNFAYQIKKEHTVLITDCMKAGMMPDGNYFLGEFPVIVKDGVARTEDIGSLAGSVLKLIDGVRNIEKWAGLEKFEAWNLGSLVPAHSMGLQDKIGSIASGKTADYVVMDKSGEVIKTAVAGEIKFSR